MVVASAKDVVGDQSLSVNQLSASVPHIGFIEGLGQKQSVETGVCNLQFTLTTDMSADACSSQL